jgi:hypothetical protein
MRKVIFLLAGIAFAVAACDEVPTETTAPETAADAPAFKTVAGSSIWAEMSAKLERVVMAEVITAAESGEAGITVLAKDLGNKQLDFDFVPFDPRRAGTPVTDGGWSGSIDGPTDDITYAVDQLGGAIDGLTQAQTNAAIDAAMATWDGQTCSDLPITKNPDFGVPLGVLAGGFLVADVMHAGWDKLNFGGGVLGVTFTFLFCAPCEPTPVYTDIDSNGKLDTAFGEIYYDPVNNIGTPEPWPWTTDGTGIERMMGASSGRPSLS